FALGILIMLAVNVLQRGIGFIRGIGLARFLSDEELGYWALAHSFFLLAVPIAVLGLPGSFGKFVEHFRYRDKLGAYVRRVAAGTLLGSVLLCAFVAWMPDHFCWLVFGETQSGRIVSWCIAGLATSIGLSFVNELAAGFRQVRAISSMHFVQSLTFTVIGLTSVMLWGSWWLLLPSFALSNLLAMLPGLYTLHQQHGGELSQAQEAKDEFGSEIWYRILPFAMSLWLMNLLSNLHAVSDRYMLLHLVPEGELIGRGLVGQYHCAKIVPNLLVSVGLMLGGVLLPYLSADWENGRLDQVRIRVRRLLKTSVIGFLALATASLVISPWLFGVVFQERYQLAEGVLPIALVQAIWIAVYAIAEPFMLCAERGKQLVAITVAALLLNVALNWYMIQSLGLTGAMWATSIATLGGLALLFWRMRCCGCSVDRGSLLLCAAPITLLAGPIVAMAGLLAIVALAGRTDWLLNQSERDLADDMLCKAAARVGWRIQSMWP
ncbi:MAG: oligosaccharide flippase family protein, partial [bacterium]|nr:oligosaccharide flippase family protein [bacterium]